MASDPLQFVGLYLDMKRRREEQALAQERFAQQQTMARDHGDQQKLAQALEYAVKVKDPKVATGIFDALHNGRAPTEQWNLVEQVAKNEQKRQREAAEAAEQEALTKQRGTKDYGDLARGLAAVPPGQEQQFIESLVGAGAIDPRLAGPLAARGFSIAQAQEGQLGIKEREAGISRRSQIAQSAAISANERAYKDYTIQDKQTGERRTVIGHEKFQQLINDPSGRWMRISPQAQAVTPDVVSPKSGVAKLEDRIAAQSRSLNRAMRLRQMVDESPDLFGAAGSVQSVVRGVMGTAGDIANLPISKIKDTGLAAKLRSLQKEYAADLREARHSEAVEPGAYAKLSKSFSSVNVGAVDVLGGMLIYDQARLNDPGGRVTDADYDAAAEMIGVRGANPTLSVERVKERLDAGIGEWRTILDDDVRRLERMTERGATSTISREDVPGLQEQDWQTTPGGVQFRVK
jgi:hypothetical protein